MTAAPNHGSLHPYCPCRVFFSHGEERQTRSGNSNDIEVIAAATPRPFHVSKLFQLSTTAQEDRHAASSSSSKPTAPQPTSGGLRCQWPSQLALFSHIRVCNNNCQPSVLHSLAAPFRLIYLALPATLTSPPSEHRWHTSGGISDYLYVGNSTKHDTRSTLAGSRASITCGKGALQALDLPPARQASTPVIRSTANRRPFASRPPATSRNHKPSRPPSYFSLTFALQLRLTPHSFPQSLLR